MGVIGGVKLAVVALLLGALAYGYILVQEDLTIREEHKDTKREEATVTKYREMEQASHKRAEELLVKKANIEHAIEEEISQNDTDEEVTILATHSRGNVTVVRVRDEAKGGVQAHTVPRVQTPVHTKAPASEDIQELPDEFREEGWVLYKQE